MTAPTLTDERLALDVCDRCDRCGAQAYYRAVFTQGELLFCGHHGRKLMEPLLAEAVLVEDGTSSIPV